VAWKLVGIAFDPEVLAGEAAAFGRRALVRRGQEVGTTTVVVHSPRLKTAIGYARIVTESSALGTELEIAGPNGATKATVVATPFFDPRKAIARR
jgi:glycine cleavage system aminomethyltransferase T